MGLRRWVLVLALQVVLLVMVMVMVMVMVLSVTHAAGIWQPSCLPLKAP